MDNPNKKNSPQQGFIVSLVLFILRVFIAIGDVVRFIFRSIILFPVWTYNVIVRLIKKVSVGTFTRLLRLSELLKPKRLPGRPKKTTPFWPRLHDWWDRSQTTWRSQLIEKRTLRKKKKEKEKELAKITLPSLRFPKISLRIWTSRRRAPPSKIEQVKSFIAGVVATLLFFFIPFTTYQWLKVLPNPELLSRRDLQVTTKIFDRNGALLFEIYNDQNRTPLPLTQIPKTMQEATIAIEDKDFYHHQAISLTGITRAVREILFNNQIQGGSTITQQLIKTALLTPDISIGRKIKEIFLAFWAERLYTKDQILEMYLNQIPYGGTSWGVEAASQTYFGKSIESVNLAEAALLAGLPAAPSEYSPFGQHPEKGIERQHEVLARMLEDHDITKEQEEQALVTPIKFSTPRVAIKAPHFVMYVRDLLEERYGPRLLEQGGLRITTTLDLSVQEKIQEIVKNQIDGLASLQVGNGAAMVTDPKTGEILAMVGSKDYFDTAEDGNVNVTTSLRQPGSSIKVVNYAAALERGFTAATIIDDSPITYQSLGSPPYSPVNYDGKFHGPTPLRYALGNSFNIPAVKVLNQIGVQTMIDKGRLMGITTWNDPSQYGLSLTLGGADVTLYDMMKVYGTLANGGNRADLNPILEVTDYTGHVYEQDPPATPVPAVKPQVAWILGNILSDNLARITEFGPNSSLVISGKTVSVKTGTTNDKRDNWTFGYTPSYVVGVWVGNNDNTPMNQLLASGITGAAPIWHDIMTELLKNKPDEIPAKPADVISIPCYFGRPEYFIEGTQPQSGSCGPLPTPTPTGSPTPAP